MLFQVSGFIGNALFGGRNPGSTLALGSGLGDPGVNPASYDLGNRFSGCFCLQFEGCLSFLTDVTNIQRRGHKSLAFLRFDAHIDTHIATQHATQAPLLAPPKMPSRGLLAFAG
ncbi:hypothetical protein [Shimia sp.]|uniref:hypothetical protein n=1 Tax=Shimia sp. TaxID=1954381 RepID=UPI003567BD96